MRIDGSHAVGISTAAAAVMLLAATALAQATPGAAQALDRTVFEVELFDENGRSSGTDQFAFVDGRLTTAEMRNLGCWSAECAAKSAAGGATRFEAVFITPAGHDVRIQGSVEGSSIEGVILWPESDDSMVWKYSGQRVMGLLDGSRFDINMTPDDDASHVDDVEEDDAQPWQSSDSEGYALLAELEAGTDQLVFERGGFESRNCVAAGLLMTSYAAEAYEGTITFAAQTAAESAGFVEWSGDVEGDRIEGTLTWTAPDGRVVYFSFSGRRVTG